MERIARLRPLLLPAGLALCLTPFVPAGAALAMGLVLALTVGHPHRDQVRTWTPRLLALAVMGLGADLDLGRVLHSGLKGAGLALVSILGVVTLGTLLIRVLGIPKRAGLLVALGTAICGGSAIAAAAPVLEAEEGEVTVALATVFLLNAAALWVFPVVGRAAGLDGGAFGLWAALGIHDTSSVVGAALAFGHGALEPAVTTKLARALWIVPLTLGLGVWAARRTGAAAAQAKRPWFILGFLGAAALVSLVPALRPAGALVAALAKRGLVLTLFLLGLGLSRESLQRVGLRPLALGLVLWILAGSLSLGAVQLGWIR